MHTESSNNQVILDSETTLAATAASRSTYARFHGEANRVPDGYHEIGEFTGWNQLFVRFGKEEPFGLVFKSIAERDTLLIAFRGSSSALNFYEDLWASFATFHPHGPREGTIPEASKIRVAAGFHGVYTGRSNTMKASMQEQLFEVIAAENPKRVYLTGHSLGAALASLFALDLAISTAPSIEIISTTFASPRVGTSEWHKAYNEYGLDRSTFRITNYWDWIPSFPPSFITGYQHVGEQFLVDFLPARGLFPDITANHSLANYQFVLRHALANDPQVWDDIFHDASSPESKTVMRSRAPASADHPAWADGLSQPLRVESPPLAPGA